MIEAEIRQNEPRTVAVLSMRGPYDQIPSGYGRLYGWIAQHGFQPSGMPEAVFLTVPDQTPAEDALWELWAPIAAKDERGADESGIGTRHLAAETVATVMHKGPYDGVAPTYEALAEWVADQGYRMAGPPREAYHSDPNEVPPEEYLTEIIFPIAKA